MPPPDPVVLPVPPSVNGLWRAVRKGHAKVCVVKSRAYTLWLEEAVLRLRLGLPVLTVFPARLTLTVCRGKGWHPRRDLDNCLKPVADALVRSGRIPDDDGDHIASFVAGFGPDAKAAYCTVSLEPLAHAHDHVS